MDLPTMNTLYKENKKKQSQRKNILFFLFFLYGFIQAQVYPVQVNHYYVPPYSPQLSDYALSTENKFTLRLLMQDIHVVNRKVKLKLYIEGSGFKAVSQDYVVGAPDIYLTGGVMQEFSSIDLRAYFEFQNLQGINSAQYSRPLNEGMYLFSWEVYDFLTNEKLSQKSTVPLYIVQNEPPLLNLPVNGENIQERTPQNLIFQWMPRHINAPNTRYLFQLRELWDNQIDPRAAFLSSPDYYTQETYGTTLLYTMANPSLIPGKTYAWRVQAVSSNGLSENHVFKNNGYSEIYYFTYSTGCEAPTFLLSEALSSQTVKLYWQGRPQHHKYHVQYRKKGNPRAEWFDVYTQNNQVQVSELEPGATYEFRVGGTCEPLTGLTQHYTYSGLQQFTLPEKKGSKDSSYNCGIQPEIKITNKNPLLNLAVNESFSAGDFTVKVKQISGQNGVYNGTGYITVPYFADTRIAVEFRGIQINTDYQLFSGVINTTYDPSWGGMSDVGTLTGEGRDGKKDIEVNFPVKEIIVQGDKILIIGENGETVEYPLGKDYQLVDSNGKVYTIDEKGNVTEGGILSEAGASNPKTTEGVDAKGSITQLTAQGIRVSFTQASDSRYAFDAVEKNDPEEVRKNYKKIDPNYYLPYKAVKNGNTDYLLANVVVEGPEINADSLIFRTQDGVAIKSEKISSGQYKLTLEGRFNNAEEEVQAVIKQKGKYQTAGAFILVHITDQEPARVVLVKLDKKAQLPASQELEKYLNQVYHPAGGIFTVGESLDLSEVVSLEGNTITTDKSGALAQYTEQQQQINQKVKELPEFDPSTYYLLITEKSASSGEIGFMPLGRQFGYVFKNSNLRTYAHELGHGVYSLKHPQEVPQGKTDLLMDYGQGTKLSRQDWAAIQNPQLHIGWFDDKNEGEDRGNDGIDLLGNIITKVVFNKPGFELVGLMGNDIKYLRTGYEEYDINSKELIASYDAKIVNNKVVYVDSRNNIMPYEVVTSPSGDALILKLVNDDCAFGKATIKNWNKSDFTSSDEVSNAVANILEKQKPEWKYQSIYNYESRCNQVEFEKIFLVTNDFKLPGGIKTVLTEVEWEEQTKEIVNKINQSLAQQSDTYSYDENKTNYKFIIGSENLPLTKEEMIKFEHKFSYLSEYAKEKGNPLEIYVVAQEIGVLLSPNLWQQFSKEVYERSKLNGRNVVLITVPFYSTYQEGAIIDKSAYYMFPGYYNGYGFVAADKISRVKVTNRNTTTYDIRYVGVTSGDLNNFISDVYKQTYKPTKIHMGLLYADGSISHEIKEYTEYQSGLDFCKKIVLLKKAEYEKVKMLNDAYDGLETAYEESELEWVDFKVKYLLNLLIERDRIIKESKESDDNWEEVENIQVFKEKYIDQDADNYIKYYAFKNIRALENIKIAVGAQGQIFDINHVYKADFYKKSFDPIVYNTLDILGTVLTVVGGDVVTDGIGLAYSVYRKDVFNMAIYSSAIIIQGVSSGELRLISKIGSVPKLLNISFKGEKYILKDGSIILKDEEGITTLAQFFGISPDKLTKTEVDNFIKAFQNKEIKENYLQKILKETTEEGRVKLFKKAIGISPEATQVIEKLAESVARSVEARVRNKEIAEEIVVKAMYIDDKLGNNKMLTMIGELMDNPKFKNPEDLLGNLNSFFINSEKNSLQLNSLAAPNLYKEYEEAKYLLDLGHEAFIPIKWDKLTEELANFINMDKTGKRLQYFKNAEKSGKLDQAIKAFQIYKKNKITPTLCP
ncbi:fibronectin type III domain-containing protein [Apibacter muscae]|nr:fibronectin type III domain-containing protein [Apibacter muscae]